MRVKPVIEGATIRDPVTRQPILGEGSDVPDNTYWIRRYLWGEIWRRSDQAKQAVIDGDTEVSCLVNGELWTRRRTVGETPLQEQQAANSLAARTAPTPTSAAAPPSSLATKERKE